jgi:NAD(P)-dependent dehydrogenase (short-subunit alcohol dehydrogenase family)
MGKLEGKIAVVTGGNSGIGLATAQRFHAEGATVFVTGRRQAELDAAVERIGTRAIGVRGDVAELADLDALYATVRERAGRIDVLFINAGGGEFRTLAEVTEEHFDKTFDINVKGAFFTLQKALPLLGPGSSVIFNGSTAGVMGLPAFSVYGATKAAVRAIVRTAIVDLAGKGIRVNVLSPGPVHTPGVEVLAGGEANLPAFRAQILPSVPMGRIAAPEEIASAVLFLASDDASFVTGAELFVDGGMAQV